MKIETSTSPASSADSGFEFDGFGPESWVSQVATADDNRLTSGPCRATGQDWDEIVAEANTQVLRSWLQKVPRSARRRRLRPHTA